MAPKPVFLPDEMLLQIVPAACLFRGLKYALRLKLVCKKFAAMFPEVLFECGLENFLDPKEFPRQRQEMVQLWGKYRAWEAFHPKRLSAEVLRIRQVVEQILCFGPVAKDGVFSNKELKDCIETVCSWADFVSLSRQNINENTNQELEAETRRKMLACAAGLLGRLDVLRDCLKGPPCDPEHCQEICYEAAQAAAYAGHEDIVKFFLGTGPRDRGDSTVHRQCIIPGAAKADRFDLVARAADMAHPNPASWQQLSHQLQIAGRRAKSVSFFNRHLPRLRQYIDLPYRVPTESNLKNKIDYRKRLRDSYLKAAASMGVLEIVQYMLRRDAPANGHPYYSDTLVISDNPEQNVKNMKAQFTSPISRAARNGHIHVVRALIEAGANKFYRSLEAACTGSSRDVVQLLLEHGAGNDKEKVSRALEIAKGLADSILVSLLEQALVAEECVKTIETSETEENNKGDRDHKGEKDSSEKKDDSDRGDPAIERFKKYDWFHRWEKNPDWPLHVD